MELVERACRDRGVAVEAARPRAGHCAEIVAKADLSDVDGVGVVGGDGTLREAVEGWTRRVKGTGEKTPVFAFPCGTGNNFCRDVGARAEGSDGESVRWTGSRRRCGEGERWKRE